MFILEESDYIDRDFKFVCNCETRQKLNKAIRNTYKQKSYYQRVLDFGEWQAIDYGSHTHFLRYKEIK